MKVVYLKSALRDLAAIRTYVGRDDEQAARRVIIRIEHCVERLASFPLLRSARPEGN
ncbi:MAG: type II toxin-antitoxin system RelE/ParE family toxin [Xanthobacteraceae bacterium]|nr:type II toxin-antitoxin system RelE/ParE family toxin [Xanthobacteraceae bacterium]